MLAKGEAVSNVRVIIIAARNSPIFQFPALISSVSFIVFVLRETIEIADPITNNHTTKDTPRNIKVYFIDCQTTSSVCSNILYISYNGSCKLENKIPYKE